MERDVSSIGTFRTTIERWTPPGTSVEDEVSERSFPG